MADFGSLEDVETQLVLWPRATTGSRAAAPAPWLERGAPGRDPQDGGIRPSDDD